MRENKDKQLLSVAGPKFIHKLVTLMSIKITIHAGARVDGLLCQYM
jgi:hypothetical protein